MPKYAICMQSVMRQWIEIEADNEADAKDEAEYYDLSWATPEWQVVECFIDNGEE